MPLINPHSVTSETPTKDTSCVTKEFPSTKPGKMLIEYSSEYPIGAPSIISTYKPSWDPKSQTISYLDSLKRGRQERKLIPQINMLLSILNIIPSLISSQIYTQKHQRGSLIIFHIGLIYCIMILVIYSQAPSSEYIMKVTWPGEGKYII